MRCIGTEWSLAIASLFLSFFGSLTFILERIVQENLHALIHRSMRLALHTMLYFVGNISYPPELELLPFFRIADISFAALQ